jgi:ATP-binding cassette, subfamily C (CFTR/MRP), member 1
MTPAITLFLYSLISKLKYSMPLDVESAFTVVAVLSMVTHPANMIMTIIPRAVACMANIERIQSYLIDSTRHDQRLTHQVIAYTEDSDMRACEVSLRGVTISNAKSSTPILEDITFDIDKGSTVICSGTVGTGKSSLARAILGEATCSHGTITVASKRIGYCSQSPWLPDGTIKDIVCNFTPHIDLSRYQHAIRQCCLEHDLKFLPHKDLTVVGNNGLNLSGGQRQRVVSFEPEF